MLHTCPDEFSPLSSFSHLNYEAKLPTKSVAANCKKNHELGNQYLSRGAIRYGLVPMKLLRQPFARTNNCLLSIRLPWYNVWNRIQSPSVNCLSCIPLRNTYRSLSDSIN